MLAPKLQIASSKFVLPMEIGITGLPRSPLLVGRDESNHVTLEGHSRTFVH